MRVGEKILRDEGDDIWNQASHDLPAWLEAAWRAVLETQDRTGQSWDSERVAGTGDIHRHLGVSWISH